MRVLIAGCGYVVTAIGAELVKSWHEVWGLRRDSAAARELEKAGIKPLSANLLRVDDLKNLPSVDTVIFCQAPSRKNDEYRATYFDATKNLLDQFNVGARLIATLRKIVLISSTSVYATTDGSWVDETTDPLAGSHSDAESRENAKVMLSQEELVLKSGHPAIVFRLAGVYGPGRNRVRAIFEGRLKPVLTDNHMNRIHIHDIVRGVRLLLDKGIPGQIYLGADDAPCTDREFYSWLFEKLLLPLPKEIADVGARRAVPLHTHGSNKRISNKKIKALGMKFRYATYREGYQPLIDQALVEGLAKQSDHFSGAWFHDTSSPRSFDKLRMVSEAEPKRGST